MMNIVVKLKGAWPVCRIGMSILPLFREGEGRGEPKPFLIQYYPAGAQFKPSTKNLDPHPSSLSCSLKHSYNYMDSCYRSCSSNLSTVCKYVIKLVFRTRPKCTFNVAVYYALQLSILTHITEM
jgi:hypothetical protein